MKRTCYFLCLLLCAPYLWADEITPRQAYAIACEFFGGASSSGVKKKASLPVSMAYASRGYYVFNRGEEDGFVVVAGDRRVADEVLGYSDAGHFVPDSVPDAMRWLLGEYERELAWADSVAPDAPAVMQEDVVYEPIEPLLTSRWN